MLLRNICCLKSGPVSITKCTLWGFMLMTIAVFGNGSLAVDRLWSKRPDKQPLAVASRPA